MSLAETEIFHETLQDVFDKAQTEDNAREYNARKHMYETMRKSVEDKIDDLRDFRRLTGEADELEREIKRLTDIVVQCNTDLKERSAKRDEAQAEVDELRAVLDMIRRWSDDAVRIAEKKLQAQQKQRDLNATLTDSSRDLKTVDRQIVELREEKEGLANKIVRLNKEMSDFNHRISEVSSQVRSISFLLSLLRSPSTYSFVR